MSMCIRLASMPVTLLVALSIAACSGPSNDAGASPANSPPSSGSEPRYGGTVVLGQFAEPVLFNQWYSEDTPSRNVEYLVFAKLMRSNERLEIEPEVAEAPPDVSADGTEWTYRLRRGVKFHDGVELTAHDVVFTFDIVMHPEYTGPRAGTVSSLAQVEALDDYTVRFTLSEPDARWEARSVVDILPRHLLEHVPVAELGEYRAFNEHPIGAGPFKLASWTKGQNIVLEAYDDYFNGRPYLDRVVVRIINNRSVGVLLLETGEIDHLIVPETEAATVERMPHVSLYSTTQLGYQYIGWNLRNPLFADRRVRQALAHAVDRQEIIDAILGGRVQIAHSPATPVLDWVYTDDVPKFDYDPEKARALLAEVGWTPGDDGVLSKDGRRFSFTLLTNDGNEIRRDLGVIVQQYFAEVGIEVKPVQMEWGAFLSRILAPNFDFDAINLSWILGLDPDPGSLWHSREIAQGLNNVGFSHPRVDELADLNIRLLDRQERSAALAEIYRIIAEEQPYLFLYYPQALVGLNADIRGFVQHPQRYTHGLEKWWLAR